ncbi:hypothetical protein PInf_019744 [Phytophthora infestans]|nr:hypothetical protein PInf_019744 [Phytophthora infestans]
MSSTPQKDTAEEHQEMEQQVSSPPQLSEKQTQDLEVEEEVPATMGEQKTEETQQGKVEEVEMEMQEESLEPEKQEHEKTQEEKTPVKAATPSEKKKPSQATSASKSATKRKFDALHARNAASTPSIPEHEKNKKARASALMKTPGAKLNEKKAPTKTREFSFARPTESSASRTTAIAKDHAHPKTTPTPPPARKPLHPKNTSAKAQHTSAPAPKTPTDKTSRPHFSYTPYTGPLPPLTVESSFAPKGSQNTSHKLPASVRKPRPASAKKTRPQSSTGKENNGVNTDGDAATNAASSSKVNHRDEGADPVGV